ncbi:MAG: SDR family oxidoreductase [Candidatus Firestonebacteria bacterium]|nr:SDR family oxidoreductase [Candidatus Firestonebacteria bacterium]
MFQSELKNKVGILTGGSSGFGFEMTKTIVSQGGKLAVFSADEISDAGRKEIKEAGSGEAVFLHQDITAPGAADTMVDETIKRYGKLDFVVANAGLAIRFEEPLLDMPAEKIVAAMQNQFAMFPIAFATLALRAAKAMAPRYQNLPFNAAGHRNDSGSIVATLSVASVIPLRDDLLAYSAAKRAALSVMESLAATLGKYNIRVNAIAPGFANTAGPKKFYDRYPNIKEDIEYRTHLKPSFLHPGAVVPTVIHLLTDNYVTGQCIVIDGGYTNNTTVYFQEKK